MALNTDAAHAQAHDHEHHVHGGPKLYAAVLGALLVLTVITVLASLVDWGGGMANVIIAMFIASIKASLVALFFMHLRWEGKMNAIIFCSTLFFLGLFLIGCYTDNVSRPALEPTNLKAAPVAPGTAIGPQGGQQAPATGPGQPGVTSAPGQQNTTPAGSSPQGSHGGAATGTAPRPEATH